MNSGTSKVRRLLGWAPALICGPLALVCYRSEAIAAVGFVLFTISPKAQASGLVPSPDSAVDALPWMLALSVAPWGLGVGLLVALFEVALARTLRRSWVWLLLCPPLFSLAFASTVIAVQIKALPLTLTGMLFPSVLAAANLGVGRRLVS